MKAKDIITRAQVIAGINSVEGNAVDISQMSISLSILHQTLNSVNNDPKLSLIQQSWDYQADREDEPVLFPGSSTPFPISNIYPLPVDCRRVLKVISGTVDLRKTDYSEILKNRAVPGMMNLYSVNNAHIHLIFPGKALLVYVKEYKEFMPQDEIDLPVESVDYLVNLLAYNLSLAFDTERKTTCKILAEKLAEVKTGVNILLERKIKPKLPE